ncbi:hypothetical protein KIN20_010073 [Parelaphostrongylus tenuis]|uniref:Uncharacterized protein n=1 Tax=Parelaphostrongylus tenuis TaxID=148309 RepID=A0AAD5MYK3_PARTN|nr:hypothetical protein KIN20_010073 [Parelaphostrongylus tenuis]
MDMKSCIIIDNTVTGICTRMRGAGICTPGGQGVTITPVAATHTSIQELSRFVTFFFPRYRSVNKKPPCKPQISSWRIGLKRCGKM